MTARPARQHAKDDRSQAPTERWIV